MNIPFCNVPRREPISGKGSGRSAPRVSCAAQAAGCILFLLRSAGWRRGAETVRPGWGTKIPLDILTAGTGFAVLLLLEVTFETYYFF